MSIETQAELAEAFVRGVVDRFGLEGDTSTTIDEDTIHVQVDGDNLGLLIGPRGATVDALQELTRTALQHRDESRVRIVVDVGGYRLRRAAALRQFAQRVAAEVASTGEAQALDPMTPSDRKVVHDAINEMTGVRTTSEGEEPRRYVVIHAADAPDASDDDGSEGDDEGDDTSVALQDETYADADAEEASGSDDAPPIASDSADLGEAE